MIKTVIIAAVAFGAGWYFGGDAKRRQLLDDLLSRGVSPYQLGISQVKPGKAST